MTFISPPCLTPPPNLPSVFQWTPPPPPRIPGCVHLRVTAATMVSVAAVTVPVGSVTPALAVPTVSHHRNRGCSIPNSEDSRIDID